MDNFEREMKESFLEEALVMIEDTESAFIEIDSGVFNTDLIEKIFRLAHNFKGSASAVGFEPISKIAHKMEDILVKIKNGEILPSKEIVTVLLFTLDTIKSNILGLTMDIDFQIDHENLVEAINKRLNLAYLNNVVPAHSSLLKADTPTPNVTEVKTKNSDDDFIRVQIKKLDLILNLVGELVVNQSMMNNYKNTGSLHVEESLHTISYMDKLIAEVQDATMSLRMISIKPVFQKMQRIVRDISIDQHKEVAFVSSGDHVEIDKTIFDKIADPLTHLIRNAVDHGIESYEERAAKGKKISGTIELIAKQNENNIEIIVKDDGGGLKKDRILKKALEKKIIKAEDIAKMTEQEIYFLIFHSGFSTKDEVSSISGRGVGMDVVKTTVDQLKGNIYIESVPDKGSCFIISLPLSLSIITGMLVTIDNKKYVVPVSQLLETIEYTKIDISTSPLTGKKMNLRGDVIPIFSLGELMHGNQAGRPLARFGLVSEYQNIKSSFEVDSILGQEQIVLKNLGKEMEGMPGVIGGAILSNGEPGLVLNLYEFISESKRRSYAE